MLAILLFALGFGIGHETADTVPEPVTQEMPANDCTDDEYPINYGSGTVLCFHVSGDGWRVSE